MTTGSVPARRAARRTRPAVLLFAVPLALVLAACGHDTAPSLPPFAALEATDIAWPPGDPCPETIVTEHGQEGGYGWARGRACIQKPLAEVWRAMQPPQIVQVGFWPERDQTRCDATLGVEPGYAVSFRHKETPKGIGSFADFDVTWREDVTRGSSAAPQEVLVRYDLTRTNTLGVQLLRGTVTLGEIAPGVTGIQLVRHLDAPQTTEPLQTDSWIRDFYAALRDQVYGRFTENLCTIR